MKKQLLALVAVLGLCGFASVGAAASGNVELRSNVVHWATVVFCVGGHTGFVVWEVVDATLSAVPGSPATTFLAK